MIDNFFIVVGVTFLVLFHLILWRRLCEDMFRFNLVKIRDYLFDMFTEDDRLSFNDPAYRSLRTYINIYIKHRHQMTFFLTLLVALLTKDDNEFEDELMAHIRSLPEDVGKVLSDKYDAVHIEFVKHLLFTAPFFSFLTLVVFLATTFCSWVSRRLEGKHRHVLSTMAFNYRKRMAAACVVFMS